MRRGDEAEREREAPADVGARGFSRPPSTPLMPAMCPLTSRNSATARPMTTPPTSAVPGGKACQSMLMQPPSVETSIVLRRGEARLTLREGAYMHGHGGHVVAGHDLEFGAAGDPAPAGECLLR